MTADLAAGMHLVVVDPPVLPDAPAKADFKNKLAEILPVTTVRDRLGSATNLGQTADRTRVVTLLLDDNRIGRVPETAGADDEAKNRHPAMKIQIEAVKAFGGELKSRGLLFGKFQETTLATDPHRTHLKYDTDSRDRIKIQIAPPISTNKLSDDALLQSALEFRLAAAMSQNARTEFNRGKAGLALPYSSDSPFETATTLRPSHLVVAFVAAAPQPRGNLRRMIKFGLNAEDTTLRQLDLNPDTMLARMLLSGTTVAVVELNGASYREGLEQLGEFWPQPGDSPLDHPSGYVSLDNLITDRVIKDLDSLTAGPNASDYVLKQPEASFRLLIFPPLDHDQAKDVALNKAKQRGKELAMQLHPLLGEPANTMPAAAVGLGRIVDERIGPGASAPFSNPTLLDAKWPLSKRWAAAQRFRILTTEGSKFTNVTRSTPIQAIDTVRLPGIPGPGISPLPHLPQVVEGIKDNSHIVVLGYSPFESVADEKQNTIFDPSYDVDHFGPQRLLEFCQFVNRLEVRPTLHAPAIRALRFRGGNGELEMTAELLPAHLEAGAGDQKIFEPSLAGKNGNVVHWHLESVDWTARRFTYRLPFDALQKLVPPQPTPTAVAATLSLGSTETELLILGSQSVDLGNLTALNRTSLAAER